MLAKHHTQPPRKRRTRLALRTDDTLVEVWTYRDNDTWKIIVTMPYGTACVLAGGK